MDDFGMRAMEFNDRVLEARLHVLSRTAIDSSIRGTRHPRHQESPSDTLG
jgi:hypothetical protein